MNISRVKIVFTLGTILFSILVGSCEDKQTTNKEIRKFEPMKYEVQKLGSPIILDGNWKKEAWKNVPALEIKNYMGEKPEHLPRAQAKLLYDDNNLYVIFRIEDQYVRAVATEYHDSVCADSCAEFFFTPSPDISQGYFNIEINAGGTMLFNYQIKPHEAAVKVASTDCDQVEIFHSQPKIIEPEITEPTTWILEYCVPFSVIEKYAPFTKPCSGVIWKANFYKCADKTSHPHWITWSVVDRPQPDFHRPEFFGTLEYK
ncbi:MAG: carbohydrate-binding family 9-like protein [Sedimentisphaerales bacterium]|nr:carbohydrate-binding family 9-like protein [Sedimentisphaerales bacterium]